MARILENNGIDNTNIDGASFNNFCAGQRSGIIKGRLNECAITSPSSSVVNVNTGELLIYGVRVVIDSTDFTFSTFPSTATRYSLIAEIVVSDTSIITHRIFVQLSSVSLIQNDLYATSTGAGTYQIELAKFTLSTSGVTDLIRTVDIITGGSGSGGSTHWEVGKIDTTTLDAGIPAEVDIDYNEDTNKYDFAFGIPQGPTGPQGLTGPQGETGPGVAIGGTTGQILKKKSATDYDTEWVNVGDDKVDKTTSGSVRRVYGVNASNEQELTEIETTAFENSTALITSGGVYTILGDIETLLAEV
jgi:hypothetical protein